MFPKTVNYFLSCLGHGSDRLSDDSSKEGVSDSHPETLTDPEFSDPPLVTSSPPQSGDEIKAISAKEKVGKDFKLGFRILGAFLCVIYLFLS